MKITKEDLYIMAYTAAVCIISIIILNGV